MRGCLSNLVPVGIFGALVATAVVPWMVARQIFGFHDAAAGLLGAGSLGLTLFLLFIWLIRLQKKENAILGTLQHPVFGEVKLMRKRWEAHTPMVPGGQPVEVGDFSPEVRPGDGAHFEAIRQRWPELHAACVEEANTILKSTGAENDDALPPLQLEELVLAQVTLDDTPGDFTLIFDTPTDDKRFQWGLTIKFHDFAIEDVWVNH